MQSTTDTDESIVETDTMEIAYEQHGTGQPLLMLHGGMAPQEYWMPVLPQFEEYACLVPDRPGFGTCLDDHEEVGPADVLNREVSYVHSLVEAIDGDPIVMGHSFGALTAIESGPHPDIEAVIAYEPAVLPEDYREQADLAARMGTLMADDKRREAVKLYIEQVLHPDGIENLDAWLEEWPPWPACVDLAEEVVRMNRAVELYDLPDTLSVDAPVLVMSGTDGPQFLRESARAVHDALPHSRFVEFDGISHSGPSEAPGKISAEIKSFLEAQR
jgi:pimeloyl-ACP methyl ester carboxylesterase